LFIKKNLKRGVGLLKISVLGCGRWGTFLAWYAEQLGHRVLLYGRKESKNFLNLEKNRKNAYLSLPPSIELSESLEHAMRFGEYVIISIGAQQLRSLAKELSAYLSPRHVLILCMKGLEADSGKRLSQVMEEEIQTKKKVAVWIGPGHVQDFVAGIPNCMIMDSIHVDLTKEVVENLTSDLIRFYYGRDLIGNEIGAAAKNVIGIAAGMLDGLAYSSLKGALMARGAREVSRLIRAMGGHELSAYGLSHLGDYDATLFSPHSQNREFGECFVKGIEYPKLAEGAATVKALLSLSRQYKEELPICHGVNAILHEGQSAKEVLLDMFLRPIKFEF
jgi:glycerol-3-phosphate dehydrogenase (NAD(P)+)